MATTTIERTPLLDTVFAPMAAKILHAAAELELPELLAAGPGRAPSWPTGPRPTAHPCGASCERWPAWGSWTSSTPIASS